MVTLIYGLALSTHLGLQGSYNSVHPYIKAEENNNIMAVYYNSQDRVSVVAGRKYTFNDTVNVEVGAVTGYTSSSLLPMVKLNVGEFFIAPSYEEYKGNRYGLTFGVQYDF